VRSARAPHTKVMALADKSLQNEGRAPEAATSSEDALASSRRRFLKQAAIVAPVVLATVRARPAWAQDGEVNQSVLAGCASVGPSGWRERMATMAGGDEYLSQCPD
jgi:hypothetical protein